MAVVRLKDGGNLVQENEKHPLSTQEAAASAADRNKRAEELGIKARYVVADE